MGKIPQDFGAGGGRSPYLRHFLQGVCSADSLVLIRDISDEPQDWEEPWRIPTQGGPLSGDNIDETRNVGAVLINASRSRYGGDGIIGDGDICTLLPEFHSPVYHDSYDTGYISGGRMADGSMGNTSVVGAGRSKHRPMEREYSKVGDGGRDGVQIRYVGIGAEGGCRVRVDTINLNKEDRLTYKIGTIGK